MAHPYHKLSQALLDEDIGALEGIVARHGTAILDAERLPNQLCALAFALIEGANRSAAACLRLGANPDFPFTTNGGTVLHAAGLSQTHLLAEAFIDAGADLEARDDFGNTPLNRAIAAGNEALAQTYIRRGARLAAANRLGYTPLHMAAWLRRARLTDLLLAHGASTRALTGKGLDPLDLAKEAGAIAERMRSHRRHEALTRPGVERAHAPGPAL